MELSARLPERPLEPGTLVVADLHLDLAAPEPPRDFLAWLEGLRDVPELLVLGDLFDFWVGPAQARLAAARAVLEALADLTRRGTRLAVVPGNRDFLLGADFEARTGGELLPEGLVGRLPGAGGRAVLVHGDQLCTRDAAYLRLRRVLRSRPVGWLSRHLPLFLGLWLARRLRRASTRALELKPDPEKAIQAEACGRLLAHEDGAVLVCGHAHRFRDEALEVAGRELRWMVLDAFGGTRGCLRVGASGELQLSRDGAPPALAQAGDTPEDVDPG